MDAVPYDVVIDGVSLIFAVAGLIWAARFAGWPPDRLAPLAAVTLGVAGVAGYTLAPAVVSVAVRGIAAGVVAAGGFAGIKKMLTNSPNETPPQTPLQP